MNVIVRELINEIRRIQLLPLQVSCLLDFSQGRTFVHGQAFARIAFNQILRLFFRCRDRVTLERDRGRFFS